MPRINNTDYRARRAALQTDWEKGSPLLSQLTIEQSHALRAFYQFDVPLRAENFSAARAEATKRDENLVARAGLAYRAFGKLKSQRQSNADTSPSMTRGSLSAVTTAPRTSSRRIGAFSDYNPDIDPEQIARIIIDMAQEQVRRDRANGESDSR